MIIIKVYDIYFVGYFVIKVLVLIFIFDYRVGRFEFVIV